MLQACLQLNRRHPRWMPDQNIQLDRHRFCFATAHTKMTAGLAVWVWSDKPQRCQMQLLGSQWGEGVLALWPRQTIPMPLESCPDRCWSSLIGLWGDDGGKIDPGLVAISRRFWSLGLVVRCGMVLSGALIRTGRMPLNILRLSVRILCKSR